MRGDRALKAVKKVKHSCGQLHLPTQFLLASLFCLISGASKAVSQPIVSPITSTPIQSETTVFKCIPYGSDSFITIAKNGNNEAALFIWERHHFGGTIPPQVSCNAFSQRLTNAVAQNQGSLKSLLLTMGRVDGQTVLCFVNDVQKGCNTSNTLFSLTPEDSRKYARKPGEFLEGLTKFPIQEDNQGPLVRVGNAIADIERQPYFSLETWGNELLWNKLATKVNRYNCLFTCENK